MRLVVVIDVYWLLFFWRVLSVLWVSETRSHLFTGILRCGINSSHNLYCHVVRLVFVLLLVSGFLLSCNIVLRVSSLFRYAIFWWYSVTECMLSRVSWSYRMSSGWAWYLLDGSMDLLFGVFYRERCVVKWSLIDCLRVGSCLLLSVCWIGHPSGLF